MITSGKAGPAADIHGPVFVSYRQSDGTTIANNVARLLRAAGVPVWRDHNDLPPGDTEARLREAIAAGISGAVVIVTPEVEKSTVMREIEIAELLDIHQNDPRFALQIVNGVKGQHGPDFSAPDRLLRLEDGTLKGVDQQPATPAGQRASARALAEVRVARHRDGANLSSFAVSMQSRNEGRSHDVTEAILDMRFAMSSDSRLPRRSSLVDLQWATTLLPTLYTISQQSTVTLNGGAHLSMAFALGAALPTTRANTLGVRQGQDGPLWSAEAAQDAAVAPFQITPERRDGAAFASRDCAVYIDAVPGGASDAAFNEFWTAAQDSIRQCLILRASNRVPIASEQVPELVANIIGQVRALWGEAGNGMVHLFLRVPYPLAVLLGRSSNTLPVTLYEWTADPVARYVPTLHVESGFTPNCVREVLLGNS